MKIFDISVSIDSNLPVWPGDPFPKITSDVNGVVQVTSLQMGAHTGTHIDAPVHFIPGGKSIESLDLSKLIGPCLVVEISDEVGLITAEVLNSMDFEESCPRIIFKTRNSLLWKQSLAAFAKNYVALSGDAAQFLMDRGVKLVGIDYLSIAPFDDIMAAHQLLLRNEVVVLEGLNLTEIDPGKYELICLPVLIKGSDGAPARAVLVKK